MNPESITLSPSYCFEQELQCDSKTTISAFIVESVFDITTYDDEVSQQLIVKLFEVCNAITTHTTYDYIKEPENRLWYTVLLNTPLLKQITEWGTSIRGAWWAHEITISACWLWERGDQYDLVTLTPNKWCEFLEQLKVLYENECNKVTLNTLQTTSKIMNKTESITLIQDFLDSPESQKQVIGVLNYCAQLSAAIAETHGFHDDELVAAKLLKQGGKLNETCKDDALITKQYSQWLEAQLLTAEFGRVMSECGEAIENIRKPGPDDKCSQFPGWQVEAIDTMIRLFDTLGKRNIRPGEIFVAKSLVNNSRNWKHDKNS